MRVLFRSVRIVDQQSELNGQLTDLFIENGEIAQIGAGLSVDDAEVVAQPGLSVSPGWVDLRVALRDPGHEQEEDLRSLAAAAARGGFTEIVLLPNSTPVVDSKDTLSYV